MEFFLFATSQKSRFPESRAERVLNKVPLQLARKASQATSPIGRGSIRISYATSTDKINSAFDRTAAAVKKLRK
jgi:hypothetical protein